jgi:hypothetical protein
MLKKKLKTSIKIFRRDVRIFLQKSMSQSFSFRICILLKQLEIRHMLVKIMSLHIDRTTDKKYMRTVQIFHHCFEFKATFYSIKSDFS